VNFGRWLPRVTPLIGPKQNDYGQSHVAAQSQVSVNRNGETMRIELAVVPWKKALTQTSDRGRPTQANDAAQTTSHGRRYSNDGVFDIWGNHGKTNGNDWR